MAGGISIGVGADTRQAELQIKRGVLEPLEDVSSALDDVARDGDRANDKLVASLKDSSKAADGLAKDADKAGDKIVSSLKDGGQQADRLEKDFKSLGDVIDKESRTAGRNLGDNVEHGTSKAKEGFKDMKEEAASSSREAAASFSDVSDVGDLVQETLANAFVGLGPAAGVAGLAAAAGFGLLTSAIAADTEASKKRVEDMFDDMIESGKNFASEEFVNQSIRDNLLDEGKRAQAMQDSATSGVALSTVLRAQAGDEEALGKVQEAVARRIELKNDANQKYLEQNGALSQGISSEVVVLQDLGDRYNAVSQSSQTAAQMANDYRNAVNNVKSPAENTAAAIDRISAAQAKVQGSQTITIDADTSAFDRKMNSLRNSSYTVGVGVLVRPGSPVN